MNLFFKSYKICFIFFLLLAMESHDLLGNRTDSIHSLHPRILKYELPNSYLKTPNISFYKSDKGIVYIGKQNGILVIDGNTSYLMTMAGPVYVSRSPKGGVCYLTSSDFGTLTYTPHIGIELHSETHKIDSRSSDFFPYNLVVSDKEIFMATSEGIFVSHNEGISHFFFGRKPCRLFKSEEVILLDLENAGLMVWRDTSFVTVVKSSDLNESRVVSMIHTDTGYKIITSLGNCYSCSDSFKELTLTSHYCLDSREINHLVKIPHEKLLVVSEERKISIYSMKERLINEIWESGKLPQKDLKSIFIDSFDDIWLLYDFEIYKIEYPSNTYSLNLSRNIFGTVLNTLATGEYIYFGTTNGLIGIQLLNNEKWLLSLKQQMDHEFINLLDNTSEALFAAGNRSLYCAKESSFELVGRGEFLSIEAVSEQKVYACSDLGLVVYNRKQGNWKPEILNESCALLNDMHYFEERIWTLNGGNHIGYYPVSDGKSYVDLGRLPASAERFLEIDQRLYLFGKDQLWRLDPDKNDFKEISHPELLHFYNEADVLTDQNDQIWAAHNQHDYHPLISAYDKENGIIPYYRVLPGLRSKTIKGLNVAGQHLWITGDNELLRMGVNTPSDSLPNNIRIVKVCHFISGNPCTTFNQNEKIPFSKSTITFFLDNIRYQTDPDPYYRYRFSHRKAPWSEWSQQKEIVFNDLRERTYTFQAQSRSGSGIISNIEEFSFTITPPFYRSWYAYVLYGIILISSVFLILKWRLLSFQRVESRVEAEIKDKMDNLIREKEISDKLVNDMFPKGTVEELKLGGRAKSEKFELATVLFSDIQGFTKIAEEMNPEVLIDELDKFFFHFDSVVEKYNIEKIKTIGDAYMAAGGIPIRNSTNPIEVVLAGLEMQQYMNDLKKSKTDIWDLRIGIHTGPVISGVVGHKKLSYDIWGDTVNTASRMESSGEGGKVNISGTTYSMVKDYFICEYRGKLPVKYKGNIDMYFVTGLRPELSVDLKGIPNRRFFLKLQLLRMKDLEKRVFELLTNNYPGTFHFHTQDHILHVYNQAELLCRSENISEEDTLLVLSSSLLMYSGLSDSFDNFENKSAAIAREMLSDLAYSEKQIDVICNLILSTKMPFEPQNKLEAILIDAKMEYLGRPNFSKIIKLMYLELKNSDRDISMPKLVKRQISLLERFTYFTVAAQRLREVSGPEQIAKLESQK